MANRTPNVVILGIILAMSAIVPIAIFLLVEPRDTQPEKAAPLEETAPQDYERLARERTLSRKETKVTLGQDLLLATQELVTAPGDPVAEAGRFSLVIPTFFRARRTVMDEGITRFFESLPPGVTGVHCEDMELFFGAENQPEGVVRGAGSVTLDDSRLSVSFQVQSDEKKAGTLSLSYRLRTGTLNMEFSGLPSGPLQPGFLPEGMSVEFSTFRLEESTRIELRDVAIRDKDGNEVLSASAFEFRSADPVDARILLEGLPYSRLSSLPGWSLVVEGLEGEMSVLGQLPAFASIVLVAPAQLEADRLVLEGEGVTLDDLHIKSGPLSLEVGSGTLELKAQEHTYLFGNWKAGWEPLGLVASGEELRATHTSWGLWDVGPGERGFSISLRPDPLSMARWMPRLMELRQVLKELLQSGEISLPRMKLPEGFPDLKLEAHNGRLDLPEAIPFLGGAAPGTALSLGLSLVVRGGLLESGSLSLCQGEKGCERLDARVSARSDVDGQLKDVTVHITGERVSQELLERAPQALKELGRVVLDVTLSQGPTADTLEYDGALEAFDLALEHRMIASEIVRFPQLRLEGKGNVNLKQRDIEVRVGRVILGDVFFRITAHLRGLGKVPAVKFAIDFPAQDCGALKRAIPKGLIPRLQKAELSGSLLFTLSFEVDLQDIRGTIKLDLTGDFDRCRSITLGPGLDVSKLNREDYVHRVVVAGEDLGLDVGPGTRGYVPLEQVPLVVQAAAYGTEDLAFYKHKGFRLGLIRRAIILILERGYYAYGGSTISQQLVKNLFLSREKTMARKLEEAVIVWQMEKVVPKERILELYLNCIEYGPRIWGITQASQTYFGKHPSQLGILEAAFLMGLKPDPKYGYLQYARGGLNAHWRKQLDRVLKRLLDMGSISRAEYDTALQTTLHFKSRSEDGQPAQPDEDRPVNEGQEDLEL